MLEEIKPFLLISTGSIIGLNIRLIMLKILFKVKIKGYFITLIINSLSCFLFGLFFSILSNSSFESPGKLGLFFLVGCLGSLSTFSTFIYDLFELYNQSRIFKGFKILFLSLIFGIGCLAIGYFLGGL